MREENLRDGESKVCSKHVGEDAIADVHSSQQVPPNHLCHHHHQHEHYWFHYHLHQHGHHHDDHLRHLVHIEKDDLNQGHEEQLYRTCCAC